MTLNSQLLEDLTQTLTILTHRSIHQKTFECYDNEDNKSRTSLEVNNFQACRYFYRTQCRNEIKVIPENDLNVIFLVHFMFLTSIYPH